MTFDATQFLDLTSPTYDDFTLTSFTAPLLLENASGETAEVYIGAIAPNSNAEVHRIKGGEKLEFNTSGNVYVKLSNPNLPAVKLIATPLNSQNFSVDFTDTNQLITDTKNAIEAVGNKLPTLADDRMPVEPLGKILGSSPLKINTSATSQYVQLDANTKRISLEATSDCYFIVLPSGTSPALVVASNGSFPFFCSNGIKDYQVSGGEYIAAIQRDYAGTLYITEMA